LIVGKIVIGLLQGGTNDCIVLIISIPSTLVAKIAWNCHECANHTKHNDIESVLVVIHCLVIIVVKMTADCILMISDW